MDTLIPQVSSQTHSAIFALTEDHTSKFSTTLQWQASQWSHDLMESEDESVVLRSSWSVESPSTTDISFQISCTFGDNMTERKWVTNIMCCKQEKSSQLKGPWAWPRNPSSSHKTTISAIYYEPGSFQQQVSDLKSIENNQPTGSCHLVWFLLRLEIHFGLIEAKSDTKVCDVTTFATMRVTRITRAQCMGHLQQNKKWESHPSGMSGGSKSHRQGLTDVWSAFQLDRGVKKGGGGGMWLLHSCPPTQPPSGGGGGGDGRTYTEPLIPRMWNFCNVMQGSLWRGNWGSSVAVPSPFACLLFNPSPEGEWLHRNY